MEPTPNSSLESDLNELVRTSRFLQAIIDKTSQIKINTYPQCDRKKLKWNRIEWASRWFFVNLAKGNIINFHINKFENNDLSSEEITAILENVEKIPRRSSNDKNSDSDPESPRVALDLCIVSSEMEKSKILNLIGSDNSNKMKLINAHYGKILEFMGYRVKMDFQKLNLLINKYIGPPEQMMEHIFSVGFRYNLVAESGFQLAIPPEVVRLFQFECFGSAYNTVCPYFSAFPEVEKYFGSRGDFFKNDIPNEFDIVSFNPPFVEIVFEMASKKLLEQMQKRQLTIVCTLPVWDPVSQSEHGFRQMGKKFEAFDLLVNSPFLREKIILNRDRAPFYDHINKKLISAVNIHILILSSGSPKITLQSILAAWPRV